MAKVFKTDIEASDSNLDIGTVAVGIPKFNKGEVAAFGGSTISANEVKQYSFHNFNRNVPAKPNGENILVIPLCLQGTRPLAEINIFVRGSNGVSSYCKFLVSFYALSATSVQRECIFSLGNNPFTKAEIIRDSSNRYGLALTGYDDFLTFLISVDKISYQLFDSTGPEDQTLLQNYAVADNFSFPFRREVTPTVQTVNQDFLISHLSNNASSSNFLVLAADGKTVEKRTFDPSSPWTVSGSDITRASGKVIIGQAGSASSAKVQITDASQLLQLGAALFESAAASSIKSSGDLQIGNDSGLLSYFALNHIFKTNGLERMRLTSVGDLLVGTALTGFNTRMVVNPGVSQASLLAYINNNIAEAFTVKKGSDVALNVRTTINDNAVEISEPGGDFPLKIYSGSQTMEAEESYGNNNDFSAAGIPKEEIYERRNAAHFRNVSTSFQLYLNVETDAVQTSNARFIMQVEGQVADNPFDIRFIVNQSDFTVTPYGNNADLPSMTITASLNSSNNINVQIGSSAFAFTCLSVHMRKHARFHSANPIPQITDIYTAADASIN